MTCSLLTSCSALQSVQDGSPALQEVPEAGKVLLWEQQRDHLLKHLSRAQTRAALRRMYAVTYILLPTYKGAPAWSDLATDCLKASHSV